MLGGGHAGVMQPGVDDLPQHQRAAVVAGRRETKGSHGLASASSRLLAGSRFLVALAVLGSLLGAATLLAYGALTVGEIAWDTAMGGNVSVFGAEHLAVRLVELTDVFLLGTVLVVVALGLWSLLVAPDLPVPAWLRVHDLNELKEKLVGVVGVLLAVAFLGVVVESDGQTPVLELGAAVALVIAALSLLLWVLGRRPDGGDGPSRDG